ncbi:MAG: chemotaxis protein [Burkholderiaceae bacterium]
MAIETELAMQAARLLRGVRNGVDGHLSEVDSDLRQMRCLLAEAIGKLTESFSAVHDAIGRQQALLGAAAERGALAPAESAALAVESERIAGRMRDAITGLQFEDMTEQLIGRAAKRIAGLKAMLAVLDAAELENAAAQGDAPAALADINQRLERHAAELEKTLWKAVCQTHMESGDVELF